MHGRWVLSYPVTNVHANVCSQKYLDIDKRHVLLCDIFHIIFTVLSANACTHAYQLMSITYVCTEMYIAIHNSYVV